MRAIFSHHALDGQIHVAHNLWDTFNFLLFQHFRINLTQLFIAIGMIMKDNNNDDCYPVNS